MNRLWTFAGLAILWLVPTPALAEQLNQLPLVGEGEFEQYGIGLVGVLIALIGLGLATRRSRW